MHLLNSLGSHSVLNNVTSVGVLSRKYQVVKTDEKRNIKLKVQINVKLKKK